MIPPSAPKLEEGEKMKSKLIAENPFQKITPSRKNNIIQQSITAIVEVPVNILL